MDLVAYKKVAEKHLGRVVGDRFALEKILGFGGMGCVYQAQDTDLEVAVALKVSWDSDTSAKVRFEREAKLGAKLAAQGKGSFVHTRQRGEDAGFGLWIAMNLVVGAKPLDVDPQKVPLAESLPKLIEGARLVALVHEEGIVHRDLKPANFLVDANDVVWLSDFGLAKLVGDSQDKDPDVSVTGLPMGTLPYMSPEQLEDAKHAGPPTDVYALGVMLYLALTRGLPYDAESAIKLMRLFDRVRAEPKIAARPSNVVPSVPKRLDNLTARALAVEPNDRPTAAAFATDLAKALGESARTIVAAKPVPKAAPAPAPSPKAKKVDSPVIRPVGPAAFPAGITKGVASGEYLHAKTGIPLVWVPAGSFDMGSESGGDDEKPVHRVTLTQGFFLGRYAVTQKEYRAFCRASGHKEPRAPDWGVKDDHPVVNVSWNDAKAFGDWAGLRLPTEAEWEYAARGTDGRKYPWGNEEPTADRCVWDKHPTHGNKSTAPVGSCPKGASPFGALDMAGSVFEWVADWYDAYPSEAQTDPTGPPSGTSRADRGGSFNHDASLCRAAGRRRGMPGLGLKYLGFRIVAPSA